MCYTKIEVKNMVTKTKNENTEVIIYQGLDSDNLVQKARPLLFMEVVPFSLGELKVLDVFLSRINSRDENRRTVRFTKEEYEELMGIERMRPERINKYVKSLMGKMITIPSRKGVKGWTNVVLFSCSDCFKDEYGQWWIDLSCTNEALELFFNVEQIGYIRYYLSNILPLTSKYSILLYLYLLDNRFRLRWQVSVDELRNSVFRCSDVASYQDFKIFKRKILNNSLSEINAKTDLNFTASTTAPHCKVGRKIINVEFTLIQDKVNLENSRQLALPEVAEVHESKYAPNLYHIAGAVNYEFDNDQMEVISSIIDNLPTNNAYREKQRYSFLSTCYSKMNYYHKKNRIQNRFKYFVSVIEKEVKKLCSETEQMRKGVDKQRSYSLENISDVL